MLIQSNDDFLLQIIWLFLINITWFFFRWHLSRYINEILLGWFFIFKLNKLFNYVRFRIWILLIFWLGFPLDFWATFEHIIKIILLLLNELLWDTFNLRFNINWRARSKKFYGIRGKWSIKLFYQTCNFTEISFEKIDIFWVVAKRRY